MERTTTDPTRPRAPAPMALLSLAGVLLHVRRDLQRIAWQATEIEARAKGGEVSAADVAQLAGQIRGVALALLSVDAVAAAIPPAAPPPAPVSRWRRAWRVLVGAD